MQRNRFTCMMHLGGDALQVRGLFADLEAPFEHLQKELKQREEVDGHAKTYWRDVSGHQKRSEPAVTRVRRLPDALQYPVHAEVLMRLSTLFNVDVQGWWVNLYDSGSAVKRMHRDGWGRDRGVNITIGASFGGSRTLRFEAAEASAVPHELNAVQEHGDVFAFGSTVNKLYRHGVPPEAGNPRRISVILMGRASSGWSHHVQMQASGDKSDLRVEHVESSRRRWNHAVIRDAADRREEACVQMAPTTNRRWGATKPLSR